LIARPDIPGGLFFCPGDKKGFGVRGQIKLWSLLIVPSRFRFQVYSTRLLSSPLLPGKSERARSHRARR
jgi:hypothetical protein